MSAPVEILELGKQRQAARLAKDFALADRLRDEIADAGWEVSDVAGSFELKVKARHGIYEVIGNLKPFFSAQSQICLAMIVSGFQDDAVEAINSIRRYSTVPIAVLCIGEVAGLGDIRDDNFFLAQINEDCGWGPAANALLRSALTEYVVIMDPSTQFTGDAISSVLAELERGDFAAVGWRGGLVNVEDEWRSVDDKGPGEVDVLFSYFFALDREAALEVGGFNPRALYYRNADMEFSLKLRHASGRLLQMELPLLQARHHGYHDVDLTFREVQSKKNYDRILDRFRGKNAILSPRR